MICAARHCERSVHGEETGAVFCETHWALLPSVSRAGLAAAYGTDGWVEALEAALRLIVYMESRVKARRRLS